jgi:hypothetical protein
MRTVAFLILISFFYSCEKNNKTIVTMDEDPMDVSELLNPDDNFSEKKSRKNKKKDSVESSFLVFDDLNKDGMADTAFITYNYFLHKTVIRVSGMKGEITEDNTAKIRLTDIGDLNGDNIHELMLTLQGEASCWDEIKLYSYLDRWVEKYNGLTYQCTENTTYQLTRLDEHRVSLVTYGLNKDSVDVELGDTLENLIPNARLDHIISW